MYLIWSTYVRIAKLCTFYSLAVSVCSCTVSLLTGLTAEDECTPCVGGMACDVQGMDTPIRPCSPGYYCRVGANSTTPELGADADVCPAGSYCPEMTAEPIPCPEGSYSPQDGLHSEEQCLNCTGGYYCNVTGAWKHD